MAAARLTAARPLGQSQLKPDCWEKIERRLAFVPTCGCWLWEGAISSGSHGHIGIKIDGRNTNVLVHRVSWVVHRGDLAADMCVLHRCDTPICVNPDHLFIGSQMENVQDMHAKGRASNGGGSHGERNGRTLLTAEAVRHIKRREMPGTAYGRLYGVSKSAIYHIWCGDNWRGDDPG